MNRTIVRLSVGTAALALTGAAVTGCSSAPSAPSAGSPAMVPAGNVSSLAPKAKKQPGTTIVSFKIVQKPKCPEGTAVKRADAVPLIISWKVTGAKGIALSVDNPNQPGSYGDYPAQGTETFTFSCGGPVGSVETHRYTINTIGGKQARRADLKASAKVMDSGIGGL